MADVLLPDELSVCDSDEEPILPDALVLDLCSEPEVVPLPDDAIVSNNGNDEWMIVHGSGGTMVLLESSAQGKDAVLEFTDSLHNVSVQGPTALNVLDPQCDVDLNKLAYFQHTPATLFGHPCRLSRTGYSGERGYEIFAEADVVGDIWDKLVTAGVMPCSFTYSKFTDHRCPKTPC